MKTNTTIYSHCLSKIFIGLFALASVSPVMGNYLYVGQGTDNNWTTGANWQGGTGPSGYGNIVSFVEFSANNPTTATSNNNLTQNYGLIVTFYDKQVPPYNTNAPSYTITGNAINFQNLDDSAVNPQTISVSNLVTLAGYPSTYVPTVMSGASGSYLTINSPIEIDDYGSLDFDGLAGTMKINGVISSKAHDPGADSLTMKPRSTGGLVILTAANTYTGNTTINGGTLQLTGTASISSSNLVTVNTTFDISGSMDQSINALAGTTAGAVVKLGTHNLTITGSYTTAYAGTFTGSGILIINGAGNLSLSGTGGPSAITLQQGTIQAGSATGLGSGTITFNGGTLQYGTGVTTDFSSRFSTATGQQYNIDTNGNTVTFGTALNSTGGSLTKIGTGTLILAVANTYAGGTTLAGGALQANSGTAVSTGTITFTGGSLKYGTGVTRDFSSQFSQAANQQYAVDTNGNTVTWATSLTSTGGTLTKSGTGTLILTGTNTYSGGTILFGGFVQIDRSNELGTGTLTFSGGALKYATGFTGDLSSSFSTAANQTYAVDTNGQSLTFASNLTSAGGKLVISGGGTLTLTGSNTFSGGTTLTKGTVRLGSSKSLGTGALTTIDPTVVYTNGVDIANPIIMAAETTLEVDGTDSATQSGTISETGTMAAVVKEGTGTLILTGTNTYTGGTRVNAGVLQGNTDSLQGDIKNNASLVFDQAADGTYAGTLSGTGSVSKINSGTLIVTGTNTLSGTFILAGGTVQAGSSTAFGTGTISFTGGALQYGNGITQDFSNQFSKAANQNYSIDTNGNDVTFATALTSTGGSFTLNDSGIVPGVLTLTGSNTYSGGTILNGGTLVAGNASALGTGTITFNGGTLQYGSGVTKDFSGQFDTAANQSYNIDLAGNEVTFATSLSSSGGSLAVFDGGTLTLAGANTYSGGTIVAGSTLVLGSSQALGTGAVQTYDPPVVHPKLVYTNGIVIANAITMNADTLLEVDNSDSATQSGNISENGGSEAVTKLGSGTLILTGSNSYTGGTSLQAGTLQAGSATALGTGYINFAGGTLQYGSGVTTDFSSQFVGKGSQLYSIDTNGNNVTFACSLNSVGGSLTKLGAGALTLAAANTYSGGTSLVAGTLITANPTALGTGVVKQTGGTLQTNNINHVITVGGNFVQTAGMLVLNINGAPGATSNDQVNVNGTASLGGSLQLNYAAGAISPNQTSTYTLVTTTGGVTSASSAYTTPSVQSGALLLTTTGTISGNDFVVSLKATQLSFATLPGTNYTPNQSNVATYLDKVFGLGSGSTHALQQALDGVSVNPTSLGSAFDQLTPLKFQSFTSSAAFNNMSFSTQGLTEYLANHRGRNGTFVGSDGGIDYSGLAVNNPEIDSSLQSVRSRLIAWSPAPSTGLISDVGDPVLGGIDMKETSAKLSAEEANRFNVFIAGDVVLAQYFSNPTAGIAGANSTTGAVQIGADYKITPHWLVGVTFGYGQTSATLDTIGSNATVNTYSPGVYASYSENGWYANALGSYGFANYNQNRKVAIGAFNGTASSSPAGDQIVGDLNGGYDFHKGNWTFGPTAGLQYTHLNVDGYTETGLPGADLTVSQSQSDSLRSLLGGRLSYAVKEGGLIFTPHLSASWQHEYLNQSRGITSQFSGVGAGSFVVNTPNPSNNSALVDLGLDAQVNDALTIFVDYAAQAGQSNYFGQSVQAGFKIGF